MPASGLRPRIAAYPCLRGQQFPETFAPAHEIFWQRIVGEETADLVLGGVDADPAALLNGSPTLDTRRRCGWMIPGVVHFREQPGDVCILNDFGTVLRFRMFAEDRYPVAASIEIVAHPIYSPSFVFPALRAGRFDGFEVGHLISMDRSKARPRRPGYPVNGA